MELKGLILWPIRVVYSSFLVWIILTTIVPQTIVKHTNNNVHSVSFPQGIYPYTSLLQESNIQNSSVVVLIAHPDDEVMFFAPTIVELTKKKNNNKISLVCFSPGDADSSDMGKVRESELKASARILGVHDVEVLEGYKDGLNEIWDESRIEVKVDEIVQSQKHTSERPVIVITFDEKGVSGHANHIAIHNSVKKWWNKKNRNHKDIKILCLKSLSFLEKYSFTLLTNVELFVEHISRLILSVWKLNVNVSFFKEAETVRFYSDLNMLSLEYAAMAHGHFSQMVWFRYGWLMFSRYLTFNELVPLKT